MGAQVAKRNWLGHIRFAQEGNALFGQWTWSGEGLKPKDAEKNEGHKVMKFIDTSFCSKSLSRKFKYSFILQDFRQARAKLRDQGKNLDSLLLVEFLDNYAETGNQYVEVLKKIIKQNNLKDFDDAKLLPASIELESLI